MAEVKIYKQSEKVLIWMHRNNLTGQDLASKIGITRQAFSQKMKSNSFTSNDLMVFRSLGYTE